MAIEKTYLLTEITHTERKNMECSVRSRSACGSFVSPLGYSFLTSKEVPKWRSTSWCRVHLCRGPVSNEISAVLPISPVIIVLVSARLSFRLCSSSRRWLSHLGSHHHLRGGLCSLSRLCGWWRIRTKQIPQRTLPPSTTHTTPHDRLKTVCLRSKKLKNGTSATKIQIRNAKYETWGSAPIPAVIDSRDASRAREYRRRDEGVRYGVWISVDICRIFYMIN